MIDRKLNIPVIIIGSIFFLSDVFLSHAAEENTVMKYMCHDLKGSKRWEGVTTIVPQKEKNIYLLIEEGRGAYSGFKEPVIWKTRMEFFDDGNMMVPIRMKKIFTDENGKTVFEGSQEFDSANSKVVCSKKWTDSKREVKKTLKYKGDIVNDAILGIYVKRFLSNGAREKSFYLVSNDPSMYKISAKVEGEEDVTLNGRTMKAYRINLIPEVGLFGVFAPKTYAWHLARPGFDWLKYRGCEDTIDSPVVEIERIDRIE